MKDGMRASVYSWMERKHNLQTDAESMQDREYILNFEFDVGWSYQCNDCNAMQQTPVRMRAAAAT